MNDSNLTLNLRQEIEVISSTPIPKSGLFDFGATGNPDLGFLTAAQVDKSVPFDIKRVYWTYLTPDNIVRGHHAHKELQQIIFAVSGELEVELETPEREKITYQLNRPYMGLYIPKLHWRTLKFSQNTVLLSLASVNYDEQEYIRSYDEFEKLSSAFLKEINKGQ